MDKVIKPRICVDPGPCLRFRDVMSLIQGVGIALAVWGDVIATSLVGVTGKSMEFGLAASESSIAIRWHRHSV